MAGHNKWAQIKYKKAASDAKKGKLFSKLARVITITAKELGSDPKMNPKLAAAIEDAKAANMPNDNIDRAIGRAKDKDASLLKEVLYEIYGPGGSTLVVTAITDNSNRTTNEVKHILGEQGTKLGEQGSALWAFDRAESPSDIQAGKQKFTPKFPVVLSEEDNKKLEALLEALDNQDDIQEVYSNVLEQS